MTAEESRNTPYRVDVVDKYELSLNEKMGDEPCSIELDSLSTGGTSPSCGRQTRLHLRVIDRWRGMGKLSKSCNFIELNFGTLDDHVVSGKCRK